jgi:hypothetical protein
MLSAVNAWNGRLLTMGFTEPILRLLCALCESTCSAYRSKWMDMAQRAKRSY